MNCYQFVFNANIQNNPPQTDTTKLLDKAFSNTKLNREEKNKIANVLYGVFGSHGSTYKLMGWAWEMSKAKQMKRILVRYNYEDVFRVYWAPDKTSLRSVLRGVAEMIEVNSRR